MVSRGGPVSPKGSAALMELWGGSREYLRPSQGEWGKGKSATGSLGGLAGPQPPGPAAARAARLDGRALPPRRPRRTHRGRASRARRRSCPGPRRTRPAARAAGRRGACATRAPRGPHRSPPPRPWLRRGGPGTAPGRDAEPRALRGRAVPLLNRGNPASTTTAKEAARPEPGPRRGRAPRDARRGSPERPQRPPGLLRRGSPGPGFSLAGWISVPPALRRD